MVAFTLLPTIAVSLLATLAATTPINVALRQAPAPSSVAATLVGAAGAQYTVTIPCDSNLHFTGNGLSISHIDTSGPSAFFGVDCVAVQFEGAVAGSQDVGPPQTIVAAACGTPPEGRW